MRKTARRTLTGALAVALCVGTTFAVAAPAQAESFSIGGSCNLSANWPVKFSMSLEMTDVRTFRTHYVVMTSPGPIRSWTINIYQQGFGRLWGPKTVTNPVSPARINTTVEGYELYAIMKVAGGNSSCSATVST